MFRLGVVEIQEYLKLLVVFMIGYQNPIDGICGKNGKANSKV
jgi:hypothetical protein